MTLFHLFMTEQYCIVYLLIKRFVNESNGFLVCTLGLAERQSKYAILFICPALGQTIVCSVILFLLSFSLSFFLFSFFLNFFHFISFLVSFLPSFLDSFLSLSFSLSFCLLFIQSCVRQTYILRN